MPPTILPSLSPSELSYLHTSLSQTPPIRPDGRTPTQFRPLVAETDILPSTNGSARVCFADGTEAVVGVKGEVERSGSGSGSRVGGSGDQEMDEEEEEEESRSGKGEGNWLEVAIDIPGYRDDDALPVFLGAMLTEALLADGMLKDRLYINTRFHWRVYIDVLLLSQPLSYPLPLLSLTTHLALLRTRLPALISEKDEDPLFNDDWDASLPLYPSTSLTNPPPITLLVMSVASNIIFDPSRDELAVADAVLAVSVGQTGQGIKVLAIRTVDPPSRLTNAGTPNLDSVDGAAKAEVLGATEEGGLWRAPRGGVGRDVIGRIVKEVLRKGGVAEEVLEALVGVEG
ncbi:ribosomal protein S5 domain 2-type protein [Delphinella strobiligena]|nr:ribosomal protein S5 domain 2-type protein [Delphinella strobiligena]